MMDPSSTTNNSNQNEKEDVTMSTGTPSSPPPQPPSPSSSSSQAIPSSSKPSSQDPTNISNTQTTTTSSSSTSTTNDALPPLEPSISQNKESKTDDAATTNTTTTKTPNESQTTPTPPNADDKDTTTNNSSSSSSSTMEEPSAAIIMKYLQKRGLSRAAIELQKHLEGGSPDRPLPSSSSSDNNTAAADTPKTDKDGDITMSNTDDNPKTTTPTKKNSNTSSSSPGPTGTVPFPIDPESPSQIQKYEARIGDLCSSLTVATGGGLGYDVDSGAVIAGWGSSGSMVGTADGSLPHVVEAGDTGGGAVVEVEEDEDGVEVSKEVRKEREEARMVMRGFTRLQTWVLSLPDEDAVLFRTVGRGGVGMGGGGGGMGGMLGSVLRSARMVEEEARNAAAAAADSDEGEGEGGDSKDATTQQEKTKDGGGSVLPATKGPISGKESNDGGGEGGNTDTIDKDKNKDAKTNDAATTTPPPTPKQPNNIHTIPPTHPNPIKTYPSLHPPTIKPELIGLTFPLLLHTYLNLLSCGLEHTAHTFLQTYRHIHQPYHPSEFLELESLSTTKRCRDLFNAVIGFGDATGRLTAIKTKFIHLSRMEKRRRDGGGKSSAATVRTSNTTSSSTSNNTDGASSHVVEMEGLEVAYRSLVSERESYRRVLDPYPFLKRVRNVRYVIDLSAVTFRVLARYLNGGDGEGMAMGGMLQARCCVGVEARDPVGIVPACVLEDMVGGGGGENKGSGDGGGPARIVDDVRWAAPVHPLSRATEAGEDISSLLLQNHPSNNNPTNNPTTSTNNNNNDNKNNNNENKTTDTTPSSSNISSESNTVTTPVSILKKQRLNDGIPFPKLYLDKEYDTQKDYEEDRHRIEFNRALLVNGFRRLEALEVKAEYEMGMRHPNYSRRGGGLRHQTPSSKNNTTTNTTANNDEDDTTTTTTPEGYHDEFVNPMDLPSILLSTLCASCPPGEDSGEMNERRANVGMSGYAALSGSGGRVGGHHNRHHPGQGTMEESNVDICCAKVCLPDGRRVAAGCNDGAVRIWSLESMGDNHFDSNSTNGGSGSGSTLGGGKGSSDHSNNNNNAWASPQESSVSLLGHAGGFPVFDVDWNRDGRTLFSAGGDGTVRLWDTMAIGPFGKLANVVRRTASSVVHAGGNKSTSLSSSSSSNNNSSGTTPQSSTTTNPSPSTNPTTTIPTLQTESLVEKSGAALAVYRGHAPSAPIYSVSSSPSGYYFASSSSDRTVRLWCTDRPTPVRIFAGHLAGNVNCVSWHPNCNYLLSGADDRTVRMWDVQSGRCVRLLAGGRRGVNVVEVSPTGRYVAGADYGGVVHVWDLRDGRRVNQLDCWGGGGGGSGGDGGSSSSASMVHSMTFSSCGSTIATGGDDCTVRIWDARGLGNHTANPQYALKQGWGMSGYVDPSSDYSPGYHCDDGGGGGGDSATSPNFSSSANASSSRKMRGNVLGSREPVGAFRTARTIVLDLKYTKRNLLLGVGKYSASGPVWTLDGR